MKPFYRNWGDTPNNATAGFEFGITNPGKDWIEEAERWHVLGELFSGHIRIRSLVIALKMYSPTDWRFYARVAN